MKLIPSIDIYKKKIVRLKKGKFKKIKKYNIKIKKFIRFFKKNNYKTINIINLYSAKKGKIKNKKFMLKVIKKFKKKKIKVNTGGGFRKIKDIKYFVKKKINVILSTKVVKNIEFLKKVIKFRKNLIVSVDIKNGKIFTKGWKKENNIKIFDFIKKIISYKVKIIITNIERDGTNKGIDKNLIKKLTRKLKNKKIIFAGGLKNKKEIEYLRKKKIYGYVSGKYFYKKINDK